MSGIDDLNNSASSASGGLNDLQKASQSLTESERQQLAQNEKLRKTLGDLASATSKATGQFSKWGAASQGVAGVAGDWMTQFGKNLTETAKGRLGQIAGGMTALTGGAIKNAGELAKASLEQHDNLIKAYRGLSEIGAMGGAGVEDLQEMLADIGTTAENVGYFKEALASVAPQLAIFGGTVAEGAKQTANLVHGLINDREQFEGKLTQFGYSTEDLMKYSATSIALQSRYSQGLAQDTSKLKQITYDYMKDLSELADLTGNSRDQQVAAQKALQNEVGWREKIRQLTEDGSEEGQRQAKRAEAFMRNLELTQPILAKAIRDYEANNGAATTEETAKMLTLYPQAFKEFHKQISATGTVTDGYIEILKVGSKEAKAANAIYGPTGAIANSYKDMGRSVYDYNLANMDSIAMTKAAAKIKEDSAK